jgi:hypothetical protein
MYMSIVQAKALRLSIYYIWEHRAYVRLVQHEMTLCESFVLCNQSSCKSIATSNRTQLIVAKADHVEGRPRCSLLRQIFRTTAQWNDCLTVWSLNMERKQG